MAETNYSTLADLGDDIAKLLNVYENDVLNGIADAADEAAGIFITQAEKDSPGTGSYKKSWAPKSMKKAKYIRYVGNTKKVKAHKDDAQPTIPLINILEFSTERGKPHVKNIIDHCEGQIADCIVSHIEQQSK